MMQGLHGMFPVPAGATKVLEADLDRGGVGGGIGKREMLTAGIHLCRF